MSHDEMAAIMGEWNKGELDSFLIEISANILKYKDTDGEPLVEKIRDAAGQKGTGKWTAISALGKIKYYALKNRTIHSSKLSKILAFLLAFCIFIDSYFILFSLEYGMPVTLIGEAVFARCLSSIKVR